MHSVSGRGGARVAESRIPAPKVGKGPQKRKIPNFGARNAPERDRPATGQQRSTENYGLRSRENAIFW